MNKYKVTSQINENFIDTEVDADSINVMETGQICFYVLDDRMEEIMVAVFPAGCAVIKVADEDAIFQAAKQKIEDKYIAGTYEVPAGNANTVLNTDYDWKSPDKKKKKVK
jgi:hypothetical protein